MLKKSWLANAVGTLPPNSLRNKALPVHRRLRCTLAGAGALPPVGCPFGRLLSMAAAPGPTSCGVAACGTGCFQAPRRPLRHPPGAGCITRTRRRPRRGALRAALVAAPQWLAGAEHPPAPPPHDGGRPGRRGGRKPATWPARAHGPRPGLGRRHHAFAFGVGVEPRKRRAPTSRRHHAFAFGGRALVLPGHLAQRLFAPGRGRAPGRADAPELVLLALEQALALRQPSLSMPTGAASTPARPAAPAPARWGLCRASAGPVTPMTTPRRKPAGAPSKPNYCPAAPPLPRRKKPAWKSPGASTPASTGTVAAPPPATARPTNLNET